MNLALNKGFAFGQMSAKKMDVVAGVVLGLAVAGVVMAATADSTFGTITVKSTPVGMVYSWITGSLGLLATLAAFVVAAIGAIAGKLPVFLTAFGVALALVALPSVLAGMFSAVLPILG